MNIDEAKEPTGAYQPNSDGAEPKAPDVVAVAAVRLAVTPNRQQRNAKFTQLGELMMEAGLVKIYANQRSGSLMIVMPDRTGFSIDATLAATQCYKYWLLTSGGTPTNSQTPEPDDDEQHVSVPLIGLDGKPLAIGQA